MIITLVSTLSKHLGFLQDYLSSAWGFKSLNDAIIDVVIESVPLAAGCPILLFISIFFLSLWTLQARFLP